MGEMGDTITGKQNMDPIFPVETPPPQSLDQNEWKKDPTTYQVLEMTVKK